MRTEPEASQQRAGREGSPRMVVIMDLDRFKGLNDHHGHSHGDEVPQRIAARMHERIRPYDSVYRLGGDEVLICLPDTGTSQALAVVERLCPGIATLDIGGGRSITASFGIAPLDPSNAIEEVIDRADAALYAAKRNGGNAIVVWSRSLQVARTGTGA